MKRFHLLLGAAISVLIAATFSACSASDPESGTGAAGGGGQDSAPAAGGSSGASADGSGSGGNAGSGSNAFEDYTTSCDIEVCVDGEVCKETRTGTSCLLPCPGQPCPPDGALVPYCDRQGGVICVAE